MCSQAILADIVKIMILVVCCQQDGRVHDSGLLPFPPHPKITVRIFSEQQPWESSGVQLRNSDSTVDWGRTNSRKMPHPPSPQAGLLSARKEPAQLERVPLTGKGCWGEWPASPASGGTTWRPCFRFAPPRDWQSAWWCKPRGHCWHRLLLLCALFPAAVPGSTVEGTLSPYSLNWSLTALAKECTIVGAVDPMTWAAELPHCPRPGVIPCPCTRWSAPLDLGSQLTPLCIYLQVKVFPHGSWSVKSERKDSFFKCADSCARL